MGMNEWKFTILDYLLLGIIVILAGTLLLFTYAAQKDTASLTTAYKECKQQIADANRGILPMFENVSIKGDFIEINTST